MLLRAHPKTRFPLSDSLSFCPVPTEPYKPDYAQLLYLPPPPSLLSCCRGTAVAISSTTFSTSLHDWCATFLSLYRPTSSSTIIQLTPTFRHFSWMGIRSPPLVYFDFERTLTVLWPVIAKGNGYGHNRKLQLWSRPHFID